LHAFDGHGVVDAGAHAADRLVAFELQQTGLFGSRQKRVVECLVAQEERHIHARAAVCSHAVLVQAGGVEGAVQQLGLGNIALLDGFDAALALEPLEDQPGHVDGVGRRRVVHGAVLRDQLVVEGAGAVRHGVAQQVVTHHHDGQPGRAQVLLGTAEGQAHLVPFHGARGHVGRKVDHQLGVATQRLQVGQGVVFEPVDGLVGTQVHVAGASAQLPAARGGNAGVAVVLVACGDVHVAVAACFLLRFVAPAAGDHKVGRCSLALTGAARRQVQRNDGVFGQATALHEQDFVVGRYRQQFAQVGFGLGVDGLEFLAAVAHLHHAHAAMHALGVGPIEHFGGGLGQYFSRHGGRSGGEVVRALHRLFTGQIGR
jgi:hypothetical protein